PEGILDVALREARRPQLPLDLGEVPRLLGAAKLLARVEDLARQAGSQLRPVPRRLLLKSTLRAVLLPARLRDVLRGLRRDAFAASLDARLAGGRRVRHPACPSRTGVLRREVAEQVAGQGESRIGEPLKRRLRHRVEVAAAHRPLLLLHTLAVERPRLAHVVLQVADGLGLLPTRTDVRVPHGRSPGGETLAQEGLD